MAIRPRGRKRSLSKKVSSFNMWMDQVYQVRAIMEATGGFDLNFERGLIHVRNTKNGKDRLIPMNATVRALLESQPKTSSYVFPSPRTGERLVEIKYSFVRAIKGAKI